MKILIIVLSYNDNGGIYSNFYETQKQTWDSLKKENIETLYLFGGNEINEINDEKILTDVNEGTIMNCGYKTIKAFDLVKDMNFDYVYRTNSSSYVDKQLLIDSMINKPKDNYYSGVIGYHGNIRFASGSGYFLSRNLLNVVLENKNLWNHNLIDDVAISDLLLKKGISPVENNRFDVYDINNLPLNYFHYRFRTNDRYQDMKNMRSLHKLKTINKTN